MKRPPSGFYLTANGEDEIAKDPDDLLDYWWDLTDWLTDGDTVASVEVIVSDSATMAMVGGPTIHDGVRVQQWLSGGAARDRAKITCRATTVAGRIKDRTFYIRMTEG